VVVNLNMTMEFFFIKFCSGLPEIQLSKLFTKQIKRLVKIVKKDHDHDILACKDIVLVEFDVLTHISDFFFKYSVTFPHHFAGRNDLPLSDVRSLNFVSHLTLFLIYFIISFVSM